MMLKGGIQEFIRHASKSSSFGIAIKGGIKGPLNKKDTKLYVDIESFVQTEDQNSSTGELYAFNKVILPYIASEFERLQRFRANSEEFSKYDGYNRRVEWDGKEYYAGELFTAFDDVLSNEVIRQVYALEGTDLEEALKDKPKLKEAIASDVKKYFDSQTLSTIETLNQNKFIDPKLNNKLKVYELNEYAKDEVLSKAYVYNSWIHNFETIGLLYSDMVQYDHAKEEMHKRNTGLTSGGLGFRTDVNAYKFINEVWSKGSYASVLGGKNRNIKYDGTFNTAILQDVIRKSIYIDDIKDSWKQDYEKRFKDSMSKTEMDKEINKRIARDIEEYINMQEGDGQGIITFDAYRTLKKLSNQWSSQQQDLFEAIANNKYVKPEDIAEFFPVYKLQYYGAIAGTQLPITGMHKFSLMPLIPSVIKEGSDMDKLHKQMMAKDIQYAVFASGSKVSGVTSNGKPDKIYNNDTQKDIIDNIQFTPNKIYLEYLKDVTKVSSKYKGKTIFATQLRKIIMESLYETGSILTGIDKVKVTQYENAVDNYTEILEMELLNDIGFEFKDGEYTGDLGKFLEVIQNELGRKEVPEHLIKMIGMSPTGALKVDLSLHLEADTIEKTLLALFEKRLIKQKVKGEALVQVSNSITNGIWDKPLRQEFENVKDPELIKKFLGSNNLPFYRRGKDKTHLMKVAIALQGDFIHLLKIEHADGDVINTIDRLNEMIKDEKWLAKSDNRASITLAGVRIPTQTLGFIEAAEVYEFLDPAAGNIIILPSEIVVKNGSDFDVDKLTAFMPSINPEGQFIKTNYTNAQLKKQVQVMKKDGQKGINGLIRNQKHALENELIRSIKEIIEIPSNYAQLTKPTSTHTLQTIAKDLQNYTSTSDRFQNIHDGPRTMKGKQVISPTRVLEVGYNLQKHIGNLTGKNVLAIAAIENALHPILNAIDAKMPATYNAQIYSEGKTVDTSIKYKMRLLLRHNTTVNSSGEEVISLAKLHSADNLERISDLFSQAMNGLVDVEKDDWISYIQANLEIVPVLFYLFSAGVPVKDAIYFVSNPLVRKYGENQRIYKGAMYSIVEGVKEPMAQPLIKYQAANDVLASSMSAKDLVSYTNKVNRANLELLLPTLKGKSIVYYKKGTTENVVFATEARIRKMINENIRIEKIENEQGDKVYSLYSSPVSNNKYYSGVDIALEAPVLDGSGNFNQDTLYKIAKGESNPTVELAAFMHFLEIEKQIKGISSVKRLANPDTTRSKTVQEIVSKKQNLEELLENSKVEPETVRRLVEESILSSFYKNDLMLKLMEPLFVLRNNPEITKFILDKLGNGRVAAVYGTDQEGTSQFIREFKNGVVNYIFQNNMSNFVNSKGEVVDFPESYRGYKINTTSKTASKGIQVNNELNTITINPDLLSKMYDSGSYLESSDLFTKENDPFTSTVYEMVVRNKKSSFFKYSIERAILDTKYNINEIKNTKEFKSLTSGVSNESAYETFLTKRALINSFNRKYLMEMDTFSYTQTVLDIIKDYPSLKDTYPILAQMTQADTIGNDKVITLSDKSRVKGDLATSYYHNLKELANPNIKKVDNADDNLLISRLFRMFPLAMIYQHGVGYSKNGFNAALPYDAFTSIMRNASANFLENQLNNNTLDLIYGRLLAEGNYKDYVVSEEEYNGQNTADKEATMHFSYRGSQRPEVTSLTTFEAIIKGERTATTRYAGHAGYSSWVKTKPGDIVKFWSGTTVGSGQSLLVKIKSKKTIDFPKMSDSQIEAWSKLEGWSFKYGEKHKNFTSGNVGVQIEFELLESGAPSKYESSEDPAETPLTIPEQVAAGTSPYRGRFRAPTMGGTETYIEGSTSVKNAIEKAIKQNKNSELTGILKTYLQIFDPAIINRSVFGSKDIINEDTSGTLGMSAATEFFALARTSPDQKATSLTERQTQTMVHELTHMLTLQPFIKKDDNEPLTEKEEEFVKEMNDLYDHVLSLPASKAAGYMRGKTDVYEFIAEAISDEEFRKFLNDIPYTKGKTVLSKLIELIRKFLNVKSGSALETVIDQVYSLREDVNFKHYSTLHHLVDEFAPLDSSIGKRYLKAIDKPTQQSLFKDEYMAIDNFYTQLTPEQKKKIGNLDELVNNYEESMYSSEETFVESIKCKL
jgi:hypothetical protein